MVLSRLLVGDDGSAGATAARAWAEALGAASGARVTVVRVIDPTLASVRTPDGRETVAQRELVGVPAPTLAAAAGDAAADLIVVGRRGAGGFDALRLGSTAHQLAEHSTRPVAVVPAIAHFRGGRWPFSTIGVGHDGSPAGAAALSWAASIAGASTSRLIVIHALDLGPAFATAGLDDTYEQTHERLAAAVDRDWCAPLREAGAAYSTVVEDGGAAVVLLAAVRSHDVDLLVVGRHAHGSFPGMAMGSVAHRALGFAPCPTVVVPALN